MPQDSWSMVKELDAATQAQLAAVLELRGADPQQQASRRVVLADVEFPATARVLDVGCGTGVLTRVLGRWPGVGTVVGVDPGSALLD